MSLITSPTSGTLRANPSYAGSIAFSSYRDELALRVFDVTMSRFLYNLFLKEEDAKSISTLIVHLNNGDILNEPCRCSLQNNAIDITRCGVVADSFLNRIYFSSEDELGNNIAVYRFDMALLQRVMKIKNLVCKIMWVIWEREKFETSKLSGEYLMPAYEHTFLIDLGPAESSSKWANCYAYIIQSAFETYHCSVQPVTAEFLWECLNFLNTFDRKTVLRGESLSDWIISSVFLNRIDIDPSLKSFGGKDYIGQVIFTGFSYNPEAAMSRLNIIKKWSELKVI